MIRARYRFTVDVTVEGESEEDVGRWVRVVGDGLHRVADEFRSDEAQDEADQTEVDWELLEPRV